VESCFFKLNNYVNFFSSDSSSPPTIQFFLPPPLFLWSSSSDLHPQHEQSGIGEPSEHRLRRGLATIKTGSAAACAAFARRGVPPSVRAALYPRAIRWGVLPGDEKRT
jgi:hypothetical protein